MKFLLSLFCARSGSRVARESRIVVILSKESLALIESSSWLATWDSGRGAGGGGTNSDSELNASP